MKETLKIRGGAKLAGSIDPQGAKNEAFQVIAAALLTEEDVLIENIPDILDIRNLLKLLEILGVRVTSVGPGSYRFNAKDIDPARMSTTDFFDLFSKLRGSLVVAGAMLGRFGRGFIQMPGGDKIGIRPVTTHVKGFIDLGATLSQEGGLQQLVLDAITTERIIMREASVTGTANIILASVLQKKAPHAIEIYNAACEPYIQQLCHMLSNMGADISGIGTNRLFIRSAERLSGTKHRLLPDMIEIGSLIALGVVSGSGILIKGARKEHLGDIAFGIFKKLGAVIEERPEGLFIPEHADYMIQKPSTPGKAIRTIYDDKWPQLSPDHISSLVVMSVYAKGVVTIRQRMFDRRLLFCDVLNQMGANIVMSHHQEVTVVGNGREHVLSGITMSSPDIRAGMALLIAALSANGESTIYNAGQIHRGYENITERLRALGASIEEE